jgi:hypothetical protein
MIDMGDEFSSGGRWADLHDSFSPFPAPAILPEQPPVGSVIGFVKQFTAAGTRYHYAAIHAVPGRWYLTSSGSRHAHSLGWSDVLEFVGEEHGSSIGIVTGWERLLPQDTEHSPRGHLT